MKTLEDNSVDAIVSDPPYGISFMAKKWDYDVPKVEVWQEAMRVLKPGGHALIACGTRTQHRMVCNIEDAGFEIRDVVSWIYGSGFPKSLNISKAIDKAAGAEREVVGVRISEGGCTGYKTFKGGSLVSEGKEIDITAPATEAAKQWDGWGTALKPACEFFTLARKPLSEKTVAANVLKWGTGGINIDGCRVEMSDKDSAELMAKSSKNPSSNYNGKNYQKYGDFEKNLATPPNAAGRFPANLIHDGSQEVLDLFPETKSGALKPYKENHENASSYSMARDKTFTQSASQGSAARFFYCAKASKKDRDEGLDGFEEKKVNTLNGYKKPSEGRTANKSGGVKKNNHPTVKPTALMSYLCRLITPTGGTVLDPYMGSGSTGKAAIKEGFDFIGCELDPDYFNIAETRINNEIK